MPTGSEAGTHGLYSGHELTLTECTHLALQIVSPKASFQEVEVSYPRFAN